MRAKKINWERVWNAPYLKASEAAKLIDDGCEQNFIDKVARFLPPDIKFGKRVMWKRQRIMNFVETAYAFEKSV